MLIHFLNFISSIKCPLLATFGSKETADNPAFQGSPEALAQLPRKPRSFGVQTIPGGDHFYTDVRPELVTDPSERTVFLTHEGLPLVPDHLTKIVHDYVQQAGVDKQGSCHMFRHTMATLMLENGADVRYLQALLGHAQLSTTELYTRVSITQLKAVHQRTHPAHRTPAERPQQLASLAAEAAERG